MAFTIRDAREAVLEHLDDERGERYARETGTNTVGYRKLDRALRVQVSGSLKDASAGGYDQFDEEIALSTSATDGTVAAPGERIAHIKGVRVDIGVSTYRVEEGDKSSGGLPDRTSRDLLLTIVRLFDVPLNPLEDDLLLGTVAGAARSDDAFDAWVCARAAKQLGIKDLAPARQALLLQHIAELERTVIGQKRNPGALPWPERVSPRMLVNGRLRWLWFPHEQTLQLVFGERC